MNTEKSFVVKCLPAPTWSAWSTKVCLLWCFWWIFWNTEVVPEKVDFCYHLIYKSKFALMLLMDILKYKCSARESCFLLITKNMGNCKSQAELWTHLGRLRNKTWADWNGETISIIRTETVQINGNKFQSHKKGIVIICDWSLLKVGFALLTSIVHSGLNS